MISSSVAEEDIPKTVSYYFDSCMDFLKDYVGEENILLAQIHYDEDTPHLQVYFLPIVDTVKIKKYVKIFIIYCNLYSKICIIYK